MQSIRYLTKTHYNYSSWLIGAKPVNQVSSVCYRFKSGGSKTDKQSEEVDIRSYYYPNTDVGIKERSIKGEGSVEPIQKPYPPFPDGKNPKTGEVGGPAGPEPTRFGDWERKGRVTDF